MTFWGNASRRRALYTFCSPGDAAASSFASFILTIIGVSLSARKRKGGMGAALGVGLALSFGYIMLQTVSLIRWAMLLITTPGFPVVAMMSTALPRL